MSEELSLPVPGEHVAARGLEPALEGPRQDLRSGGLGALIYFYFAARRVYGLGRFATSGRLVLALAVQGVALSAAVMASVVVTALTL